MTNNDFLNELMLEIRQFAEERDWEQFHSPKNLSMALAVEASELMEHFQWLTQEESSNLAQDKLQRIEEEIADVQIYLIRLCDRLNIDLLNVASKKLQANSEKYPVDVVKGSAKKYSEY